MGSSLGPACCGLRTPALPAPSGGIPAALEDADERNLRGEQLRMHLRAREVPGLRASTRDHFPEGCSELALGFVIVLERVIQYTLCMAKQFRVKWARDFRAPRYQLPEFVLGGTREPSAGEIRDEIGYVRRFRLRCLRSGCGSEEGLDISARKSNDLVRFEHQFAGLISPSARWRDSDDRNPYALILSNSDALTQILVSGQKESVGNSTFARQRHEVSIDEGIHAFLLAPVVDSTQSELEEGQCSNFLVGGGSYAVSSAVIPVAA